jgi:hypothetical protein
MAATVANTDNTQPAKGSTKREQDGPWKEALAACWT